MFRPFPLQQLLPKYSLCHDSTMPACEGCHKAKVKCDLRAEINNATSSTSSCSRCQRLSIVCVRRISRQGQRPNNTTSNTTSNTTTTNNNSNNNNENNNKKRKSTSAMDEDDGSIKGSTNLNLGSGILKELNPDLLKRHYGVKFLIHHWTSLSFSTRTFSLLARACKLAAKADVSMDSVFSYHRREVLEPLIWRHGAGQPNHRSTSSSNNNNNIVSNSNNNTYRSPLQWSDIPQRLRQLSQMPNDPNDQAFQQHRYFWVRESKDGQLRFLVTQAFSDEIASQWLLDQTVQSNQQCVTQFLTQGPADLGKFLGAIQYSVARYVDIDTPPIRVRTNGIKIRYRIQPQQPTAPLSSSSYSSPTGYREMDMLACFEIVSLDHSFYVAEFVVPSSSLTRAVTGTTGQNPRESQSITNNPTNGRKEEVLTTQIYYHNTISPLMVQEMTVSPDRSCSIALEGCPTLLNDLEMDDDLQQIFDLIQSQ
jgi:hypothetical protein